MLEKRKTRKIIDIAMTLLLPMLMAYSLIGEKFHEIAGTLMLALFIAHHVMNRGFFKGLFQGRYTAGRAFRTAVDLLLLAFMVLQPVSGIMMSKHLYTFINIPGVSSTARKIHLCLAYWGFALMCLHAGTHMAAPIMKLKRKNKWAFGAVLGVSIAIALYGGLALHKRRLADYLFMRSAFVFFDFSEPILYFFLDYMAMMVLFAFAGILIARLLARVDAHARRKSNEH